MRRLWNFMYLESNEIVPGGERVFWYVGGNNGHCFVRSCIVGNCDLIN